MKVTHYICLNLFLSRRKPTISTANTDADTVKQARKDSSVIPRLFCASFEVVLNALPKCITGAAEGEDI